MPAEISIPVRIEMRWDEEPGDGTLCTNCGDASYLTMKRMIVIATMVGVGRTETSQNIVLCRSCGEAVQS